MGWKNVDQTWIKIDTIRNIKVLIKVWCNQDYDCAKEMDNFLSTQNYCLLINYFEQHSPEARVGSKRIPTE